MQPSGKSATLSNSTSPDPAVALSDMPVASASLNASANGPGLTMTLQNGQQISLPNYASNLDTIVDTTGANGATELLANTMAQVAQELLAKGEITQDQANLMMDLSNQGHRMGALEKVLEDAALTAKNPQQYLNAKVTFDNKQMTVGDLREQIGWDGPNPDSVNYLSHQDATPELEKFLTLYDKLSQTGALKDPAVNGVVTDLVTKIGFLSEAVEDTASQVVDYNSNPSVFQQAVSKETHGYSADICKTGSGSDTGIHCSS